MPEINRNSPGLTFLQAFTLFTGATAAAAGSMRSFSGGGGIDTLAFAEPGEHKARLEPQPARAVALPRPRNSDRAGSTAPGRPSPVPPPALMRAPIVLSDGDTPAFVPPGEAVALELVSKPSTGFSWHLESPLGTPRIARTEHPSIATCCGTDNVTTRYVWSPEQVATHAGRQVVMRATLTRGDGRNRAAAVETRVFRLLVASKA